MLLKEKLLASQIYLILTALFVTSLVVSNLIFQKFFFWNPFGWFPFELSVGLLPYPITFLITDVISEIYGKKKSKSDSRHRNIRLYFFDSYCSCRKLHHSNCLVSCWQLGVYQSFWLVSIGCIGLHACLFVCAVYRHSDISFLETKNKRKPSVAAQ